MESSKQNTLLSALSKPVVLIVLFFLVTPLAIAASLLAVSTFEKSQTDSSERVLGASTYSANHNSGVQVYAALPSNVKSVSGSIVSADSRVEIIKAYMLGHKSPLTPYADYIVEMADKYGLDYRLLVAIAMKESGICKVIPPGGHNCWGWGIHSAGTLGFDSYETSIETVTKGLKEEYYDKGYVTPAEIMQKYIPHSPEGIWATDVQHFMDQMQ